MCRAFARRFQMAEFTSLIQSDPICCGFGRALRSAKNEFWMPAAPVRLKRHFRTPYLGYALTPCGDAFICVRFGRVTCGRTTRKPNVPMPVWQAKRMRIEAFMY